MTTETQTQAQTAKTGTPNPAGAVTDQRVLGNLRRKKKVEGRKKRALKLKTDRTAAKAFFEAKSKRSTEKKSTFRKKKNKKK